MAAKRRARTSLYCGPLDEIEPAALDALEGKDLVAEEKYDGAWCAMTIKDGCAKFESRTGLEFSPLEIAGLADLQFPKHLDVTVVGELGVLSEVATKEFATLGYRRLRLFDCIIYKGQDVRDEQLLVRKLFLWKVRQELIAAQLAKYFPPVLSVTSGFRTFMRSVLGKGGEGLVLKPIYKAARPTRADGKTPEWVRCKPWKTVDYVVTEPYVTEKGQLGAKLALVRDGGRLHNVLKHVLPGLSLAGCEFDGSLPEGAKLKQQGQVVEFYGREVFESGALRHAQFKRFRPDKTPADCVGTVSRLT